MQDENLQRTALVVALLESRFGVPRRRGILAPLDSLILTILSQSTSDQNSGRAFDNLRSRFPTWREVMDAPVNEVEEAIRCGGLSRQKSARIQEVLGWVEHEFGELDLETLKTMDVKQAVSMFTAVPGIGLKTISVVLLFSCRRDIFPVDVHVHRICKRLGFVPEKASPKKTHHAMSLLVPKGKAYSLHINLLRLGREVCRPQHPKCQECCLNSVCEYAAEIL